jgi:hypothetical protein
MKYYLFQSNIQGGHYLDDLGIHVPSDDTVRLTYPQVRRSISLDDALENDLITVVKELDDSSMSSSSFNHSNSKDKESNNDDSDAESFETSQNDNEENKFDIEALLQMNKQLMATVQKLASQQEDLTDRQEALMDKMDDYIDSPTKVVEKVSSEGSEPSSEGHQPEPFVPEKIRRGEAEASGELEMGDEEEKSSSSIEEAADLLSDLDEDE